MPELLLLSKGGIRGLLVDSAVRGAAVTILHRQGIRVISYPHALSNPDGTDKRLNPNRVEKSQLRYIAAHINPERPPSASVTALGGAWQVPPQKHPRWRASEHGSHRAQKPLETEEAIPIRAGLSFPDVAVTQGTDPEP